MNKEQDEIFKKGFTFTQITKAEFELLEKKAKSEHRTLTSLLTVHIKELVKKLKEEEQEGII
ncbi:hypothetical protein [Bernardetia sp. MNP-M8]|uniref:hypothetical protein n=1 Tax=Bernardetia sp. MNP-M8 TaxID=3127470 RepID=UPI0030D2EE7B